MMKKRRWKMLRKVALFFKRLVGGHDDPASFDVDSPERRRMMIDFQRRDYYND